MKKDLTFHYSTIVTSYWMGFAVLNAFASLYLLSIGYSNTSIGMLVAIASTAAAFLQPLLSSYADSPKSPAIRILMAFLGGGIVLLGAMALAFNHQRVLSGLFYGAAIALLLSLQPLVNALGMDALNQKERMNFGLARSTGSIGYAVIASVMGIVASHLGSKSVPFFFSGLFLLFAFCSFSFPLFKGIVVEEKEEVKKDKGQEKGFFLQHRRFFVMLLGCVCLYISHILINNYTLQIVQTKGGSSREMGIATSIAAFAEMPTMFLFSFYLKRMKCRTMLYVSGIFFTLKCFGSYLVKTMMGFYAVQFLQMFGWGLLTVALVYYVNEVMDQKDSIKGQGYAATAYTLGAVIGALFGGSLADQVGIDAMLLFGTAVAALGTAIIYFAVKERKAVRHA